MKIVYIPTISPIDITCPLSTRSKWRSAPYIEGYRAASHYRLTVEDDHYRLEMSIPGINNTDLTVNLTDGHVVVKGNTGDYCVDERIYLSKGISKATARLVNGVLVVHVNKPESAKSISVPVG